jgi:hypothetical protein
MPYNANIPQPTDRISVSQGQILDNFAALQTSFGVNHVTYDAPSNIGKHNVVTFPSQAAAPGLFAATEFGLYNMVYPRSTVTELFVRRNNAPIGNGIPFTASFINAGAVGYTMLPSGLQIKFGKLVTGVGFPAGTYTHTFSDGASPTHTGPAFTQAPYVTISIYGAPGLNKYVTIPSITNLQFQIETRDIPGNALINTSVSWIAIGI